MVTELVLLGALVVLLPYNLRTYYQHMNLCASSWTLSSAPRFQSHVCDSITPMVN